jgi:uncharacterized OB-fold protein
MSLTYLSCHACRARAAVVRTFCPSCGSFDVETLVASGRGTVFSITVMHRAPTEAWTRDVPYAIALVDLEEGPRVMCRAPLNAAIGDAVEIAHDATGTMLVAETAGV